MGRRRGDNNSRELGTYGHERDGKLARALMQ